MPQELKTSSSLSANESLNGVSTGFYKNSQNEISVYMPILENKTFKITPNHAKINIICLILLFITFRCIFLTKDILHVHAKIKPCFKRDFIIYS